MIKLMGLNHTFFLFFLISSQCLKAKINNKDDLVKYYKNEIRSIVNDFECNLEETKDEIYSRWGCCEYISLFIYEKLMEKDEAKPHLKRLATKPSPYDTLTVDRKNITIHYHFFLVDDRFGTDQRVIIDTTFAQFCPVDNPKKATIDPYFVGTEEDLKKVFTENGFYGTYNLPETVEYCWGKKGTDQRIHQDFGDVENLFEYMRRNSKSRDVPIYQPEKK